jgi:hypothetical protein
MPLIKDLRIARDPERYWRSRGWGPEWRFPVARPGDEPLALSLRVPIDWKAVDVLEMPAEVAATPGSLSQAMARLAREVDASGVIAVLGIARTVAREGKPDAHLFATITFALTDVAGPAPDSIPGAEVEPIELNHPGAPYRGVRVRRVRDAVEPGKAPMSFLTVQYLVQTGYGWLATTFATPQRDVFERLGPLLDKIAGATWLDPAGQR